MNPNDWFIVLVMVVIVVGFIYMYSSKLRIWSVFVGLVLLYSLDKWSYSSVEDYFSSVGFLWALITVLTVSIAVSAELEPSSR